MSELNLDELSSELEGLREPKKQSSSYTAREERIIAGFEDIERFYEEHGRLPLHGEGRDIFERLYAVRLDRIRTSPECLKALEGRDKHGLIAMGNLADAIDPEKLTADELEESLSELKQATESFTQLKHVRPRAELKPNEEIARRTQCLDFEKFKPLFAQVQNDLKSGVRKSLEFKQNPQVKKGNFFILGGLKVYVADVGEQITAPNGEPDARLRLIFDNGTESNMLMRSLQNALYKDQVGRRISDPNHGSLFSGVIETTDVETGTIYVLRSKSDYSFIKEHREVIHKIGVTSGSVKKRIARAALDPTYLMADVEIVATYKLSNINPIKLEKLLQNFFESARLNVEIKDRFGNPIAPQEWFLVPLQVIDETVAKIKDGTITEFFYNAKEGRLIKDSADQA